MAFSEAVKIEAKRRANYRSWYASGLGLKSITSSQRPKAGQTP